MDVGDKPEMCGTEKCVLNIPPIIPRICFFSTHVVVKTRPCKHMSIVPTRMVFCHVRTCVHFICAWTVDNNVLEDNRPRIK